MRNPLLHRKQMVIDVQHENLPNVSKDKLREKIMQDHGVKEKNTIALFGFQTQFGGQMSTGFCLVYDGMDFVQKFEPKYRLRRLKLMEERTGSAKAKKEKKNKLKKLRSKAKREAKSM